MEAGNVCKYDHDQIGVITHTKKSGCCGKIIYCGIGFNGEPWQTNSLYKLADNIDEFIEQEIKTLESMCVV